MRHKLQLVLLIASVVGCGESTEARVGRVLSDSLALHMNEARRDLAALSDSLQRTFTASVRREADSLAILVAQRRSELLALEDRRRRELQGLPGVVSLDSLNSYYAARWNESGFLETFDTRAGTISFGQSAFTFAYLRSPRDIAFIRIGRTRDSYTSREMIQSWLRESIDAKQRQGYQRVYARSGPAEYGEFTESLYRKSDAYIKTFFRYSRIQGTYDRHSLEYDFFVKVGSTARADRYKAEQYNSRIGS